MQQKANSSNVETKMSTKLVKDSDDQLKMLQSSIDHFFNIKELPLPELELMLRNLLRSALESKWIAENYLCDYADLIENIIELLRKLEPKQAKVERLQKELAELDHLAA